MRPRKLPNVRSSRSLLDAKRAARSVAVHARWIPGALSAGVPHTSVLRVGLEFDLFVLFCSPIH